MKRGNLLWWVIYENHEEKGFWDISIYLLNQRRRRTSVSFIMKFNNWRERRNGFSWHLQSIILINQKWNIGVRWFVKPLIMVQCNVHIFVQRIDRRSIWLVQISCICSIKRFVRFKRWGKRIQVVSHKLEFRIIRFVQFFHKITDMTCVVDYLVRIPDYITQLSNFLLLFLTLCSYFSHKNVAWF